MAVLADHIIVQVRLHSKTNLTKDVYVNTLHFKKPSGVSYATAAGSIAVIAHKPWSAIGTGSGVKISTSLSSTIKQGTDEAEVVTYDGSVAPGSRVPTSHTWTPGGSPSGGDLPAECSVVVSFKAAPVGTSPLSHQRGRIYIGPLSASVGSTYSNAFRVDGVDAQNFANNFQEMAQDIQALGTGYAWCVYSQASNALYEIATVSADNEFDTQRRRGSAATARYSFTV